MLGEPVTASITLLGRSLRQTPQVFSGHYCSTSPHRLYPVCRICQPGEQQPMGDVREPAGLPSNQSFLPIFCPIASVD
jgi:hypothetical protein